MSTNRLVTCPYDEAHKVKESRLQVHITKCKRNHLNEKEDKFICPFNASHVLNKGEETYHIQTCPDRAPVDRKLCQNLDRNNPYKGRTAVPSYNESAPVITEELWDVDIDRRSGYMPPIEPPVGAIMEPPPYSKPAERRRLYQELHRLPSEQDNPRQPQPTAASNIPKEPKQPTEVSKVEMLRRQNVEYQNLGLGRGRGAPSSRIAANFLSSVDTSNRQPTARSYSAAMSSGMHSLGLGRGHVAGPALFSSGIDNSEDFPALGFGRGASANIRNGMNGPSSRR